MAVSWIPKISVSSKQLSKKMIAIQLVIVFLLGFFFVSTLDLSVYRSGLVDDCPTGWTLCRSSKPEPQSDVDIASLLHQQQPIVPITRPKTFPYTIVTASSANHLCSLENFLYSLNELRAELEPSEFPRVVVYNIGMNRTQLPVLDQLVEHGLIDDLVTFDYFKYPRFWDVALNAGEYAWKTGIVNEARLHYTEDTDTGILVWLDAGNLVTADFLRHIPSIVRQHDGFWSPRSSYRMGRWTHPGMFDYYGVRASEYAKNVNCNGAAVGFDARNQTIVDTMIIPWYECGLNKRCIAPPGSSRKNHRQDQAALTFLAYRNGHSCKLVPNRFHNLQIHRDVSCRANLLELEVQGKLNHPSSIGKYFFF
ncbi:uncharacterized protein BYT42DRAFT_571479 [Radiomyces spectabilis]|uniref:uncharacterized protein n=1 Tax=Radiomyces spectabilis TaxID=64574 RepID=UPI00221F27DA|nr:uncharacterized protein BYT42DRAFT_571479 [Radiomyces spectabilis]KAI8377746.1 hypothetical protein BYT42DRAFT_571479 [Radiomyces spectabilis]